MKITFSFRCQQYIDIKLNTIKKTIEKMRMGKKLHLHDNFNPIVMLSPQNHTYSLMMMTSCLLLNFTLISLVSHFLALHCNCNSIEKLPLGTSNRQTAKQRWREKERNLLRDKLEFQLAVG